MSVAIVTHENKSVFNMLAGCTSDINTHTLHKHKNMIITAVHNNQLYDAPACKRTLQVDNLKRWRNSKWKLAISTNWTCVWWFAAARKRGRDWINWCCMRMCVCSLSPSPSSTVPLSLLFFGDIVSIGMKNMHVPNDMFWICWTYLHEKSIHVNFSNQLHNDWMGDCSFLPFYPC